MKIFIVLIIVFLFIFQTSSFAGRNTSAFTLETQTLNQGDFEFEQWLWGKVNPLGPSSSIAWIWFAPVLLALRYGMGPGLLSVIMITTIFVMNESSEAFIDYMKNILDLRRKKPGNDLISAFFKTGRSRIPHDRRRTLRLYPTTYHRWP